MLGALIMHIIVISDTHDNLAMIDRSSSLIFKLDPEMIIHLGDYVSPFTLRKILDLGIKFLGVFGNNDGDKLLLKFTLGGRGELHEPPYELSIDGLKFLLIHGFGSRELTNKLVNSIASGGEYDLLLYGHTHIPRLEKVGNTVILNPGTLSGYLSELPTLAYIDTRELIPRILNALTGDQIKYIKMHDT